MAENWSRLTGEEGGPFDIFGILGLPDSWCCPGVMESVVALGMNDEVAQHLSNITDRRFALHTYARFLFQFGCTILGASAKDYYSILNEVSCQTITSGGTLSADNLAYIINEFKKIQTVPDDPWEQLRMAITEAYDAWFDNKNTLLREDALNLPSSGVCPAICLQAMVFGGLGVCFTRCPLTGKKGTQARIHARTYGYTYAQI
jgi:pyruvate,orthophosphate dikinase